MSASLGATLDEIYQRLIDCDFVQEDPGPTIFVVALLNALGREGRGNRPTEVALMLASGDSVTAERGRNRLMSWRRGEMSGHELAREPGLSEQRDHRLCRMPLSSSTCAAAHRRKRLPDGPGPSFSVGSSTAAPPLTANLYLMPKRTGTAQNRLKLIKEYKLIFLSPWRHDRARKKEQEELQPVWRVFRHRQDSFKRYDEIDVGTG